MKCFKCHKKKSNNFTETAEINIPDIKHNPYGRRRSRLGNENDRILSQINPVRKSSSVFKPLYELKDRLRCLFCGGEKCKHEDWTRNKNTVMIGMNCDKINNELLK